MRRDDADASLSSAQAEVANRGLKAMMPIASANGGNARPFLDYVISTLADAGVTNVVLVLGPEHHDIRAYYDQLAVPSRVNMHFAEQALPLGTANAVVAAADTIGEEPFLVLNADNFYPREALEVLVRGDRAATIAFDRDALVRDGNIDAERVRAFAVLDVSPDGWLTGIIEKPGTALDLTSDAARWVGMNCWALTPAIVDACRRVPKSTRGEYELPEAVGLAIREGVAVHAERMAVPVLDLSQRADIASVARRLAEIAPNP